MTPSTIYKLVTKLFLVVFIFIAFLKKWAQTQLCNFQCHPYIHIHTPSSPPPKKIAPSGLERVVSEAKSLLCRGQIFYHSLAAPLKSALALHSIAPSSCFEKKKHQWIRGRCLRTQAAWLLRDTGSHARVMLWETGNGGERVSGFKQFNSKVSSGREPQPPLRGWACEWVFMHFHQQWYHSQRMQFRLV